jgi:hypothetical protein
MNWIQRKLRKWLGIELAIEESNKSRKMIYELQGKIIELEHDLQALEFQCKLLPKITDGGMDVGIDREHHRNWAVFCATGGRGQDYVKFVDISSMEFRDVVQLAKSLDHKEEYSRFKIDAPMGMKEIFYSERRR